MPKTIFIMNPGAAGQQNAQRSRRVLDGLKGKVVGFVDNSKPNFNNLVDDLGELMLSQYGVKKVVKHRKAFASVAASEAVMNDLEQQCDLVITGSGD